MIAGLGSWLLVRALAATGVLSSFAAGREHARRTHATTPQDSSAPTGATVPLDGAQSGTATPAAEQAERGSRAAR